MAQHNWLERNPAEQAGIFALAFRAGLANLEGGQFFIQPATVELDRRIGTDLFLFRGLHSRRFLRVDLTDSREQRALKIKRTVKKAKEEKGWVYILGIEWGEALFTAAHTCFNSAYAQLIRDGKLLAIEQACPEHGNECGLAPKLWSLGQKMNYTMASSTTEARYYVMPVSRPPF